MPDKLDRCVADVKAKDGSVDNAWAVCNASIGEIKTDDPDQLLREVDNMLSKDYQFPPSKASYKHKGNMTPTVSDHNYANTSAEEKLQEIDDMISKQASFPLSKASYDFTGSLVTKLKPNTFGNTASETVSIPGGLSAVKIKGKKREGSSMLQETVYKTILDATMRLDGKLNSCGCKKKLKIKETTEGGAGSGRKRTLAHGAPTFDVPSATSTPKAKPAMPQKTVTPTSGSKPKKMKKGSDEYNRSFGGMTPVKFMEDIMNAKIRQEGGPGSGPQGGRKDEDPAESGDADKVADEYLSWLDENDMLVDAKAAQNYMVDSLGMDPEIAKQALLRWGADPSLAEP